MFRDKKDFGRGAFTLVELLMALTVSGIILAAVASLAFAFSSAYNAEDETAEIQSRLRITTLRISELIKKSKLVLDSSSSKIALWQGDFNGNNKINPNEVVYIETGNAGEYIRLVEFDKEGAYSTYLVSIYDIQSGSFYSMFNGVASYTAFIPNCSNASFTLDANPPYTKLVTLSFDLTENGITSSYSINSVLRCWAGNLINKHGTLESKDDD